MIYGTLLLTLLGALAAQVNPVVLKYTVDEVSQLIQLPHPMKEGIHVLGLITIILLGKEIANIFIQFGQKFYGEKIRIKVSSDLAQAAIDKILTYRIAYYNDENHEGGKLQIRIDRGIESLTRLVQNFFIDILPLFFQCYYGFGDYVHAKCLCRISDYDNHPIVFLCKRFAGKKAARCEKKSP